MARHRELAQVMYDKAVGRTTSAGRIWRSVVFAGAMLGTPLIAAADAPAPPAKNRGPAQAAKAPAEEPPRPLTPAEQAKRARDKVTALERELVAVNAHVKTTKRRLAAVKPDSEAATVIRATVAVLDKLVEELESQAGDARSIAARLERRAGNANKPRPRPPRVDRPTGRGFVLS